MTIRYQPETDRDKALKLLCCNGDGCGREQSFAQHNGWTDDLMRAQTAVYGWSSRDVGSSNYPRLLDYCPFCEPNDDVAELIDHTAELRKKEITK